MHKTELQVKALETYIKTGNMALTLRILKESGYIVSRSTLDRWKKEAKGTENDWKVNRDRHLKDMAVQAANLSNLKDQILTELIADRDQFRRDLKGREMTSQDGFNLLKMTGAILDRLDKEEGTNRETDNRVQQVIDLFFDDPVISKRLDGLHEYIVKKVDEIIGKGKK